MSPNRDGTLKPEEISCQCLPTGREDVGTYTPIPQVEVTLMKFEKPGKDEEIVLSQKTRDLLERRKEGCFLCRFVLEDEKKHGKLTSYPLDGEGKGQFPVSAKMIHVQLEQNSVYGDSAPPRSGGAAKTDE